MSRRRVSFAAASCGVVAIAALLTAQGPANEFKPDTTFTGSSLTGWTALGAADWQAQAGEIVGRPRAGGQGGWLVLDKSYQDVNFFTRFRCVAPCQAGVLFRLRKTGTGITGVYVSLKDDDLKAYRITLDAEGRETARDALRPAAPFVRVALPPAPAAATAPASGRRFFDGRRRPWRRTCQAPHAVARAAAAGARHPSERLESAERHDGCEHHPSDPESVLRLHSRRDG